MPKIRLVGGAWDQKEIEVKDWAYTIDTPVKENKKRDRYCIEQEHKRGLYIGEVN